MEGKSRWPESKLSHQDIPISKKIEKDARKLPSNVATLWFSNAVLAFWRQCDNHLPSVREQIYIYCLEGADNEAALFPRLAESFVYFLLC